MIVSDRLSSASVLQRLSADFFGPVARPSSSNTTASKFFVSREFRFLALTWLCRKILSRDLSVHDGPLVALVDDESKDIIHFAFVMFASDDFFVEQAAENNEFFRARIHEILRCDDGFSPDRIIIEPDRAAYASAALLDRATRTRIAWSIYDSFGLGAEFQKRLPHLVETSAGSFFAEDVLAAAIRERRYRIDARRGFTSIDLAKTRLQKALSHFVDPRDAWECRRIADLSESLLSQPRDLRGASTRVCDFIYEKAIDTGQIEIIVGPPLANAAKKTRARLMLSDLLSELRRGEPPFALERDYHAHAIGIANQIITHWRKQFLSGATDEQIAGRLESWKHRLLLDDGIIDILSTLLLSDLCLGAIGRAIFEDEAISRAPGCFFKPNLRAESLQRIVTTTFFYWFDQLDGSAFIACPDSMVNEEGQDSLTVSPADRADFTYQSFEWHKSEILDMMEAGINVILPVAYNHPFSLELAGTEKLADELHGHRILFADAALRVFRRAWLDLDDQGKNPPRIAMFFDTSSLNRNNRFKIQIHYRRRYGEAWFYESIRNFFSQLPTDMWAFYQGKAMVFVYHPSFGLLLGETLYDYCRERFRRDFGHDLYIVTASEDEAPRVLNTQMIDESVRALQTDKGIDVLARTLAKDDIYQSAQSNDQAYAAMLGRRLVPNMALEDLLRRYGRKSLLPMADRVRFTTALLTSQEFAWNTIEKFFVRLLRQPFDQANTKHCAIADEAMHALTAHRDWLAALTVFAASDEFYSAAGGTDDYFVDWVHQSIAMKHVNTLCTPNYHPLYGDAAARGKFLAALQIKTRREALREFLENFDVCQGIVSAWYYEYYGWYYPGPADSDFYWSAAISPTIRGVASIGPGYDQSKLRHRGTLFMPRQDGKTYEDAWSWVLAMQPSPRIVHLETWNEFFEGTAICRSKEYGSKYIDLTRKYATQFLALPD